MIETNARHYADLEFKLYAVSTYVPGKTLRELPKGSYTPEDALRWTIALCDILHACRKAGIRHRDLKPDNCIRSDNGTIYLVDFGLALNVSEEGGFKTQIGQEIGNRFLRLPEFRAESANRDDPRSDLTMAVGILFFLLTQQNPRVLLDEQGRLPHQRASADILKGISLPRPERLMRVFDQGFQHNLDGRFQSAEALSEALVAILEPEGPGEKGDILQRRILEHANSPSVRQGKSLMAKLEGICSQINGLCDSIVGEMAGVVGLLGGPLPRADMSQSYLSYETGFLCLHNTRQHIMLGFGMRHLGTEIVVSVFSNQVLQFEIRVPAASAQMSTSDLARIRDAYIGKIAAVLGVAD